MEDFKKEVLNVSVSPVGHEHLKTLAITTRWSYIFSIVISVILFLESIARLDVARAEKYSSNLPLYIEMKYATWVEILMTVLTPIEFYLYYRFVRRAKKAVDLVDAEQFNQSFRYMVRGNYLALLMMALNVFLVMLQIWIELRH